MNQWPVRGTFAQRLDEWLAFVVGVGVGLYVLWGCLVSITTTVFVYHTRLNLGHPVPISLATAPLTFVGLVLLQLGFAFSLLHNVGWWGLRHILRRSFPALGWPRDGHRMPGMWLVFVGALVVAIGLARQTIQLFFVTP